MASLVLQPSSGGLNILDLVERIGAKLDPTKYRLLLSRVATTLGGVISNGPSLAFDEERASSSLQFFTANTIPSVSPEIPKQVSGVRFSVDLTTIPPISNFAGCEHLLLTFAPSPE